jgi:DNA/RNA-binding domain of Phe-tRNA-synthetase-like protein
MTTIMLRIDDKIRQVFPDVIVGGFVVDGLDRTTSLTDAIRQCSLDAKRAFEQAGLTLQNLVEAPLIKGWRSAFKTMGVKPSTYKSSAERLGRRIFKDEFISSPIPIVSLYCAVSAKHLAPLGGYDLDRLPEPHVLLRFASADSDSFTPLSGRKEEMPLLPDIAVYVSGREVICWGFNYRDSANTCLQSTTSSAVFLGEAVMPEHHDSLGRALSELRELLLTHGAMVGNIAIATPETGSVELSLEN